MLGNYLVFLFLREWNTNVYTRASAGGHIRSRRPFGDVAPEGPCGVAAVGFLPQQLQLHEKRQKHPWLDSVRTGAHRWRAGQSLSTFQPAIVRHILIDGNGPGNALRMTLQRFSKSHHFFTVAWHLT